MKPTLRHFLELHLIVAILSFTAILGLLLRDISPLSLIFWRTALAAIGLQLIMQGKQGVTRGVTLSEAVPRVTTKFSIPWPLLALGVLLAVHWMLFFGAARLSNASVCLAGISTGSLWTAFIDPLVNRRRLRGLEVAMGLVVILGLYVIFVFEFDRVLGLVIAVASAGLAALFSVFNARLSPHYDARTLTFWEMIGANATAAVLLPVYHLLIVPAEPLNFWPQGLDWFWLAGLALICTVYAYSAMVRLLRVFSAFTLNLSFNLEPVYGIGLAFLIFGESERMTTGFYFGAALILAAVLGYPWLNRRKIPPLKGVRGMFGRAKTSP